MWCRTCLEPLKYSEMVPKGMEWAAPEIFASVRQDGTECGYCQEARRRLKSEDAVKAKSMGGGEG